jgi:hypothetical protein
MRAREFVNEAKKRDRSHWGLHNPQISGVHIMPGIDQGYEMYRLGLDLACAGGKDTKWPEKEAHPAGDNSVIVAYSEGDHEIVGQVMKHRNVKHKDSSKGPSREHKEAHTVSPVRARTKNRYGV